jgi:hypothetical protein
MTLSLDWAFCWRARLFFLFPRVDQIMQALSSTAPELLQVPNFTEAEAKHCVHSTTKRQQTLADFAATPREKLKVTSPGMVLRTRRCSFVSPACTVCALASVEFCVCMRSAPFLTRQGIKTMSEIEKEEVFRFLDTIPNLEVLSPSLTRVSAARLHPCLSLVHQYSRTAFSSIHVPHVPRSHVFGPVKGAVPVQHGHRPLESVLLFLFI